MRKGKQKGRKWRDKGREVGKDRGRGEIKPEARGNEILRKAL